MKNAKSITLAAAAVSLIFFAGGATFPTGQLRLGTGLFRYSGSASESPRALVIATSASNEVAVADVSTALTLSGGASSVTGSLMKVGAGTLTLGQPTAGMYKLATTDGTYGDAPLVFGADDESPTGDFGALTVVEGRLVLDAADGATNLFCSVWDDTATVNCRGVTYIGKGVADGMDRSAHLDIYGGYNHFGEYLFLDYLNGSNTAVNSSLNLYGGTLLATWAQVGDCGGVAMASRPELNIYGGTAKIRFLRIANSRGAKGRVCVRGGRLEIQGGIYCASDGGGESFGDPLLPDAELIVSEKGYVATGMFAPAHGGLARCTVRLASGGWLQLWGGFRGSSVGYRDGAVVVVGNGGTLRSTSDTTFTNTTWRIGEDGFIFSSDKVNTLFGAIENDPDATGDIGTFTLTGNGTAKLFGNMVFTGGIATEGTTALVLSGNVTASKITMASGALSAEGADATIPHLSHATGCTALFSFAVENGAARQLHLTEWDVPGIVRVNLKGLAAGNTYTLFTCPASCGLTADALTTASVNDSLASTYTVTTVGGISTVRVTAAGVSSLPTASVSWGNTSGGDWATGLNWTGGSAPASGVRTAVSFPTGSAAEHTAVSLNSMATLSGLAFTAQPGYAIGGSGSIDIYKSGTAVVSSTLATNSVAVPMSYSGTMRLAAAQKARLELASLSGMGDVTLNDGETGGAAGVNGRGAVVVADASGLRGALAEKNGLFETAKLGNGITGITAGYGVFRYTGAADYSLNGPLTLAASRWSLATVDIANEDATFTVLGPTTQTVGGFWKKGKGTLVLDGDGINVIGSSDVVIYGFGSGCAAYPNGWTTESNWPIDGGIRVPSYCGFLCAAGKTVWGKEGQTVRVGYGPLWIGSTTTATPGGEYDAEAVINGGETILANGDLIISRNHGNSTFGTAENTPLLSRLVLNAGKVSARSFQMPNNDWYKSVNDSQFIQNGGELALSGDAEVGWRSTGGTAIYTMNGGRAMFGGAFRITSVSLSTPVATTVNLNGGTLETAGSFSAYYGPVTINLNEGATLRAPVVEALSTGDNTLNWDGGLFVCTYTNVSTLTGWKTINIGAKGAWLDTSGMTAGQLLFKNLVASAEGALHICGSNPMRNVAFQDFEVNEIPVMVEKGGSMRLYRSAGTNLSVTVKNGGLVGSRWVSADDSAHVKDLTLGTAALDRPMLFFTYGSGCITPIRAWNSFTANGKVEVALINNGQTAFAAAAFTNQTLLIAPKGSIDASKFMFTDRSPTAAGTFTVASYDADYDQLTVTITMTSGTDNRTGHTWTAAGEGAWTTAGNWDSLPGDVADDKVIFPSTLAEASVSLDGDRTLGALTSAVAGNLTLSGGTLAISSSPGVGGRITVTAGSLTLPTIAADGNGLTLSTMAGSTQVVSGTISTPAPATAINLNPSSGAGTVRLAASQGAQAFTSSSGTLEGPAAAFGGGALTVKNSTLRVTAGGFFEGPVVDGATGMNLRTEDDTWFDNAVSISGPFVKTGPGTAYLAGAGSYDLGRSARGEDNNSTEVISIQPNGDLPTYGLDACNIAAGKIAIGLDSAQQATISSRIRIGSRLIEFGEDGEIVQPTFEIHGGTVSMGDIRLGVNCGRYRAIAGNEGKILRPTFNVYGGTVTFNGFYSSSDGTGYANAVSTLNLYGGTMTSSSKWIAIGYHRTSYLPSYGQAKTILNIYGGKLSFTSTTYSPGPISAGNADVDINLTGGELAFAGPCKVMATSADTIVNIRFDGGTLSAPELLCATPNSGGIRALRWDGGTFRPTATGKTLASNWTASTVGAKGAIFDLSAIPAGVYSLDKSFAHDADAPAEDGGIELTAGGTLVLNAVNTMTGPVTVRGGTVRPAQVAAVPSGIVLAGGTFDCNGLTFTLPYLKGQGGAATNGVIAVAGTMAALDPAMTNAPYATVANLEFGNRSVVACPAVQVGGEWCAPYFRVTRACSGRITLDFGRDDSEVLPTGFRVKVAEYTSDVTSFPSVTGVNFGVTRQRFITGKTVYDGATGVTSVYAVLCPPGMMVILR